MSTGKAEAANMASMTARFLALLLLAAVATLARSPLAVSRGQPPGRPGDITPYRAYLLDEDGGPPRDGAVRVTYLGTSTLLFDDGQTRLLIDGFLTRPSLLRLARGPVASDPKVVEAVLKRAGIDRLAAVFVSHSHYDHVLDVPAVVRRTGATLYGSASTLNVARGGDVAEEQLVRFTAGRDYHVGRFTVTVLAGKHSPPIRGLNDDLGQTIDEPLRQPADYRRFKEGGSFDFLIRHGRHGNRAVFVNPSGNFVEGALERLRAEVVFLSVGGLDQQSPEFRDAFYEQTVGKLRPKLVVPIHWDNFFQPLGERLSGLGELSVPFDFLIRRLKADGIRFGLLQGFQSVTVFPPRAGDER